MCFFLFYVCHWSIAATYSSHQNEAPRTGKGQRATCELGGSPLQGDGVGMPSSGTCSRVINIGYFKVYGHIYIYYKYNVTCRL
jgi:hypothetical protein